MIDVNNILEAFEAVIHFLEKYDIRYIPLKKMNGLWDLAGNLRSASNDEQQHEALLKIRFLMGHMGSALSDFTVTPPANSDLSPVEANEKYVQLVERLFVLTLTALGEPLPKFPTNQ